MSTLRENAYKRFRIMSALQPSLIELPATDDEPAKFLLSALIHQPDGKQYHFPLGELYTHSFDEDDR